MKNRQVIESLLIASEFPLSSEKIANLLKENSFSPIKIKPKEVEEEIEKLNAFYKENQQSFEILKKVKGWQIYTRSKYAPYIEHLFPDEPKRRLSKSALETLSIIAYKQPITRSEIEEIRGVSSDNFVQKLFEYELIQDLGNADLPGKPQIIGTSEKFLDYFGIQTLKELPAPPQNERTRE